mgnify:CR=1 FL=1
MKSALITFDFDENKESLCETFGTTADRISSIAGGILTNPDYKTITKGVVSELEAGNITGGELLALASVAVSKLQEEFRRDMIMKKVMSELIKHGPSGFGAKVFKEEDLPEEVRKFLKKLEDDPNEEKGD